MVDPQLNYSDNIITRSESDIPEMTVSITRGTQSDPQTPLSVLIPMAELANKFLHSSYCYMILNAVFTNAGLLHMSRTTKVRQSISINTAKALISNLLAMDFMELADVRKPYFSFADCSVDNAVKIIGELDEWLLEGCEQVLCVADSMGNQSQIEVIETIVEEQKIFVEESKMMNNHKLKLIEM